MSTYKDIDHYRLVFVQKPLPFPLIAGLVRLGRKYDFKELLDAAVECLMLENPTTLEEYDALRTPDGRYIMKRIVDYPGIFFDILTLARECNMLSVLPCAYVRAIKDGSQIEVRNSFFRPSIIFMS
jgi:hypothetical protein